MTNVVSILHPAGNSRIDRIRAEIVAGMARAAKAASRTDWTEGSLQIAAALIEAKSLVPAGMSVNAWFVDHQLNYFSPNDRIALIGLGGNPDIARKLLDESERRSYQTTWNHNRHLFMDNVPPPPKPEARNHKRRTYAPRSRAMIHYTLKLGEETMAKIRGTSLDSSKELDELMMLNRGAEDGQLLPLVRQLVEDAASGKAVSALASSERHFGALPKRVVKNLQAAWLKRMTHPWQIADLKERAELLVFLLKSMPKNEASDCIEYLIDNVNLKEEPS